MIRAQQLNGGSKGGPLPYRFDDLGACTGCVVELVGDRVVQDSRSVSFDGEAGQTEADLRYGQSRGGVLTGTVLAPSGIAARLLTVAVLDGTGKTLADTASLPFRCTGTPPGCPSAPSYSYRLIGLPASGQVKVVLRQTSDSRRGSDLDSADVALDPSGTTIVPELTAIADFPTEVGGRTLYGQLNNTAPFAPGARKTSDLAISPKELIGLEVELRGANGSVVKRTRDLTINKATGYVIYSMTKLDACDGCTVALDNSKNSKKPLARLPVTIPKAATSVTRRDLDYARDSEPEYLNGTVIANGKRGRSLVVTVSDATTGKRLTTSMEGDDACGGDGRCLTGGEQAYRIGSIPPDRDVVLALAVDGRSVDSRRLRTSPAGEVTQAPALIVGRGRGPRSLQVQVTNAGPFAPGRTAADPGKPVKLTGRLLDGAGTEVSRVEGPLSDPAEGADYNTFFMDGLAPCTGCTLELSSAAGVEDRAPVDVRSDSPSVAIASVGWRQLTGGVYVQGAIVDRTKSRRPTALDVQVLSSANKVLADSAKLGTTGTGSDLKSFAYRLGGIPRDAGKVKVVVLDGRKRVASTTVTIAPGGSDTKVPDLKVDAPSTGRER